MPTVDKYLAETISSAIDQVVGNCDSHFIPLHEPCFGGREKDFVTDAINSTFVSSVGAYVTRFEKELAEYCGVKRAVLTVNGTAALHTCLSIAGVHYNDEVITPAMSFVATANAVSYCGAIPHFADSEEDTLGICPNKLRAHLSKVGEIREKACFNKLTKRRIAAIVPMHTFGHPVKLKELLDISHEWSIPIIEDAAESLGSLYNDRHTGSWGLVNALSFNGNKIITTGGGGAILTNDEALADSAMHITTTAKLKHPWKYEHNTIGWNYRMPNLNAALGVAQLEQLPFLLTKKRMLSERYQAVFKNIDGVKYVTEPKDCRSNYWLCTLLLDRNNSDAQESILKHTNRKGLMTRPAWVPMHQLQMYQNCPRMDLSIAENLAKRIINIPSSATLSIKL